MHKTLCKRPRWSNTWALFLMGLIGFFAALVFSGTSTTHAATVWVNSGAPDLNYSTTWNSSTTEAGWWRKRDGSVTGQALFCVQLGAPLNNGDNTGFTTKTVTDAQHAHISEIAYYGYYSQKSYINEMFTQWMIWEYLGEKMTSWDNATIHSLYNTFKSKVNAKVAAYDAKPSFNGKTVSVTAGKSISLTDTNKSLSSYASTAASQPSGITATISGNTLKIAAAASAKTSGTIGFKDDIPATYKGVPLLFQRSGFQTVIEPKIDPVSKIFSVKVNVTQNGYVKIVKQDAETTTAQNGSSLAGAQFKLTDTTTGTSETLTAGSDGSVTSGAHAVGDKFSVVETKAPAGYYLNSTPVTGTFSHQSGDTTYSSASLTTTVAVKDNYIYHARIKISKQDSLTGTKPENGMTFANAVFKLTDTTSGATETLTTDANGNATSTGVYVVGDKYTVVETTAPKGYQLNGGIVSGTFTRTKVDGYSNTNALTVKDTVIPDQVTIHKVDETGKNLVGIKFKIADTEANLKAGKFLKLAADGKTVVFPGQANYSASLQDYVATTNDSGIATWSNIVKPATKTDRQYYFREVSTDKDHQLLTKSFKISAGDQSANDTTKVTNQTKIHLPNTGSNQGFVLAGLIVLALMGATAGSVVLFGSESAHEKKGLK